MIRSSELKFVILLFVVAFLTIWIMPLGVIFAQDEEGDLLRELNLEEDITSGGEGKIEVLGLTEEQAPILGNRLTLVVTVLIVAAVGGLVLSFVIKARA
jgi:hypothetical protein